MKISMQGRLLAVLGAWTLVTMVLGPPVEAGPLDADTWYEFSYLDVGDPTFGCDPADPGGLFCTPSSGTPTIFGDAPPWTFDLSAATVLTVVDAFESGDRFEVFDFGVSIGVTSAPQAGGDCGDDPVPCLADASMSSGLFALGTGAHSITLGVTESGSGSGSGFLRVSEVPEPGVVALVGLGLVAIGASRRRALALSLAVLAVQLAAASAQAGMPRYHGPTSSQPIALSADDAVLAVANPDNNSVSVFDVRGGRNVLAARVPVQHEPNGVAVTPDGRTIFAANTASGTVTVFGANVRNGVVFKPRAQLSVGTEPYALCMAPNGTRLYVANARSNTVSVIDPQSDAVIATVFGAGREPRGLALTNDGDGDDLDETLVVTSFLAAPIPGRLDGADDAKQGEVTLISTATNSVIGTVDLNPLADTGFRATGDAIARIPPADPNDPANFLFTTGAYPNQLNGVAIHGGRAFVPSTGASPNGPVRFNVNTQSLLSVIDLAAQLDAGRTINMHAAVAAQTNPAKRFLTQPWAIAFEHGSDVGWVASAASNVLAKIAVDPGTGAPTVQLDPEPDPPTETQVLEVKVGRNPRGIVIDSGDTRAYVMNQVSRDVSVVDLVAARESVIATLPSAPLPTPGTPEDLVHVGRELYNTSIGEFDPATPGGAPIVGRMSKDGWGACSACHPFGLSDNVVWIFASGPRRTIPQHADFDPTGIQRPLNWSAIFDEEADFELNIRNVSGGAGLIVQADGVTPDPNVAAFTPLANKGRQQLQLRGVGAWDAIEAFVRDGIRAPISPVSKTDPDAIAGRALFTAANCQSCHGSAQWTQARVRYVPPPTPGIVNPAGEIIGELRQVGTFDPSLLNEVRQNGAGPLGADGFVPPSLLSAFAFEDTQLHNGDAGSFDEVLDNVQHRSAGTAGVDTLTSAADRDKVAKFLRSIDAASTPIP
jgi:YVTN family beta-propeller protein